MQEFKIRLSLRYKLLLLLTILPVTSLALFLLMATDLFRKDKVAYVFDSSATFSRSLATQMRMDIEATYASLKLITERWDAASNQFSPVARELFDKSPKIHALILQRKAPAGQFVTLGQLIKDKPFAQKFVESPLVLNGLRDQALLNSISVSDSGFNPGTIKMGLRLGKKTDAEQLVVLALYQADDLVNAFDASGLYGTMVLTRSGSLSIGSNEDSASELPTIKEILKTKASEGTAESHFQDGRTYLVSYAAVGLGDLIVVSKIAKERALKAVQVLLFKSLLFFGALIALTLVISVYSSEQLTSALSELFVAAGKIAQGNFNVHVPPRSNDEVGGLTISFNHMAKEVSRLMQETAEKARMQNELATVKTVQETLFPPAESKFGPLRIRGHFEPASECGGDWWSYSFINNKVYLWIGDATGHGAPAALITSAARSAAAVIESMPDITPGRALSILNRAIHQTSKGQIMMTFFVACIDPEQSTFTYSCASHDPPYLMRRTGQRLSKKDLLPLNDINGPRLGDKPGFVYQDVEIKFSPGDMVFFYTDGILDIENPKGEKWGERAFLKTLIDSANKSVDANAKVDHLREVADQFRAGAHLIDDVTMVMCEYEMAQEAAA